MRATPRRGRPPARESTDSAPSGTCSPPPATRSTPASHAHTAGGEDGLAAGGGVDPVLGAGEAGERALGADAAQVVAPDAVVGDLLLRAQRRVHRAALGLEVLVGDRRGDL